MEVTKNKNLITVFTSLQMKVTSRSTPALQHCWKNHFSFWNNIGFLQLRDKNFTSAVVNGAFSYHLRQKKFWNKGAPLARLRKENRFLIFCINRCDACWVTMSHGGEPLQLGFVAHPFFLHITSLLRNSCFVLLKIIYTFSRNLSFGQF